MQKDEGRKQKVNLQITMTVVITNAHQRLDSAGTTLNVGQSYFGLP